mgnify:CR=1 FL=1
MATYKQLSDAGDGTILGQSASDLVGFHGATPSDQYATVSNVSGTLGDTNAALSLVIAALKEKGLIAT